MSNGAVIFQFSLKIYSNVLHNVIYFTGIITPMCSVGKHIANDQTCFHAHLRNN